MNGTLFFAANDGISGNELWKSDGTTTTRVMDIYPGSTFGYDGTVGNSSNPVLLTNVNGTLFFRATDGISGYELWKSDGTTTTRVADIYSGSGMSNPGFLTNVNGTLFFRATDGISGYELWKSDGTTTMRVADIRSGTGSSYPQLLTNVNGTLFFRANDGSSGVEVWKSDGTTAGTTRVADINSGSGHSNPGSLTNVNGTLFFSASDGTNGFELWKSDGTTAGTTRVADINSGSGGSNPSYLTNVNGTLFFTATDGSSGRELWKATVSAATPTVNLSVSANSGSEAGQTAITVTATASSAVSGDQFVTLAVTGTGLTAGDYTLTDADSVTDGIQIKILDGQTTGTVTFTIVDDLQVEETETATLTIASLTSGLALGTTTTQNISITDNDSDTVSIANVNDGEEVNGVLVNGKFRVTQSAVSSTSTMFIYLIGGMASAGNDYTTLSGMVTILAGTTFADIDIAVLNDAIVEVTETVTITALTKTAGDADISVTTDNASLNITDNDSATVSITNVNDGDETGTPTAGKFRVTQSAESSMSTVLIYTIGGMATPGAGNDYTTLSGTVTIQAGQTMADIDVTVLNDAIVEGAETVTITALTKTAGDTDITVATDNASLNITDNDTATFTISGMAVNEAAGTLTFTVSLDFAIDIDVTIDVSYAGGSASGGASAANGVDYQNLTDMVTFSALTTGPQLVTVAIFEDIAFETPDPETFISSLAVNAGTSLGTRSVVTSGTGTGGIIENDTATAGTFTAPDNGTPDAFRVVLNDGNIETRSVLGDVLLDSRSFASLTDGITINGANGKDDTLTIDFGGGNPFPTGGITFNGGIGGNDSLIITDGSFTTVVYNATAAFSGNLNFDSGRIVTFTGLEPVDLTGSTITNLTINVDPGNTIAGTVTTTIAASGETDTLISFDNGLESALIGSITGTLTIAGDNADTDIINVSGVGSSFAAALTITGEGGSDTVNLNGDITFAAGQSLLVTGESINVAAVTISTVDGDQTYSGALDLSGSTLSTTRTGFVLLVGNLSTSGAAVSSISGFLNLSEATRTFTVADVTESPAADLTVSAAISGTGAGLTKDGSGTMVLAGANTYDGVTTIIAGTLLVNGSTATGVILNAGGTLGGTGTVNGTVTTAGGTIAPGQSAGQLTVNNDVTFDSTATFNVELNGTTVGSQYDQLRVTGSLRTVALAGANLSLSLSFAPAAGDTFTIIDNVDASSIVTGEFASLNGTPITLSNGSSFTLGTTRFLIHNNGGTGNDVVLTVTPLVTLAVSADVSEDSVGTLVYTFTRTGSTVGSLTVNFSVTGSATLTTLTSDYLVSGAATFTSTTGTVTFADGSSTAVVTVDPVTDTIVEDNETIVLTIASGSSYNIGTPSAVTGTINNDDTATYTISDATVTEGGNLSFTISLSNAVDVDTTVNVTFTDGTTSANDFTHALVPVTFLAGNNTAQVILIATTTDTTVEANETLTASLALNAPLTGGRLSNTSDTDTGTITNDDTQTLTISSPTITEGTGGTTTLTFTVTSPSAVQGGFTAAFSAAIGTAGAGDFSVTTASPLTFAGTAGEMQTISVDITTDAIVEANEQFTVTLGTVAGTTVVQAAAITTGAVGTGTITNDDTQTLTISSPTITEGTGGTTTLTFTVTSPSAVQGGFTAAFSAAIGTAGAGDFSVTTASPLTFAGTAGEPQTVSVNITTDAIVEANEQFTITLGDVTNTTAVQDAAITTGAVGTGTINNDDTATYTISDATVTEGGNLSFTVSLSNPVDVATQINVSFTDGSTSANDFTHATVSVTFLAGSTTAQGLLVATVNDTTVESNETFTANLALDAATPLTGGRLSNTSDTDTGTITNDDTASLSVDDISVAEDGTFTFTITSDRMASEDMTVVVNTADGTATLAGSDYTRINGQTATITAGMTSTTVMVTTVTDDADVENNETFTLNLSDAQFNGATDDSRVVIGDASGTATIENNDAGTVVIGGELLIVGTADADVVKIRRIGATSSLPERYEVTGTFPTFVVDSADVDAIRLLMGDGDDSVTISSNVKIAALIEGQGGNDKLIGGSGNDTLSGGTGADNLNGGRGTNTLAETADVDFTLTNKSLIGLGTDRLANLRVADLTGGASSNTFTVSGWSGQGSFNGGGDVDNSNTIVAVKNRHFTLSNTAIRSTDKMDVSLSGFSNAVLTGGRNGNQFIVGEWTGTGTINGAGRNDRVVAIADTDMALSNSSLVLGTGGTFTLVRVEFATLTGGEGENTFTLTGWSGKGVITGGGDSDTVAVAGESNFKLTNTQLVVSNGLNMTLAGISAANLTGGAANNVFTVSGWTGTGSIDGALGTDQIVAVRNTDMLLTDTSFAAVGFGTLGLVAVETANLSGGVSSNKIIAEGFTLGSVTLKGNAGNDVLIGGTRNDSLDGGSGRDILIGGEGVDSLFGGAGEDILIGGTSEHSDDADALGAIIDAWADNTVKYADRVVLLRDTGVGEGLFKLDASTVQNDADADADAADRLTGNANLDWFFQSQSDVLVDFRSTEINTDLRD